ncbi:ribose ABC transporter permease [Fastidiosibacter lacustris]|uniref:ribose ABC transporter permease n=1 Tax=Fastidiosibacter lacustris TaxID=2056695 RepID=UPI000E346E62|nr:ribose ABC transporter permease [Fastidiosibacter lacustris]
MGKIKYKFLSKQFLIEYKAAIVLIIMVIVMSCLNEYFLTWSNILVVLQQTSVNAIIAVGMTFVILTKGIDLSVGSVLALCGMICAFLLYWECPLYIVIPLTILVGIVLGAISGIIVTKGVVQPFIATLITMTLFRGLTMVFSNGYPVATSSDAFAVIGTWRLFGVPVSVYITAMIFGSAFYILKYTRFGRYVYATGGNEEAAKLAGIRINNIKLAVYVISGALAAVAAMVITSRLSSAQPTAGTGYELDAIAAVVLGGTSLFGGKGKIIGTLMGALIIGLLSNALNLMDVSSYYQMIVKAFVILIAVLFDFKVKN